MSTLKTPFRYDFVGSFLRPEKLKAAKKAFEGGTITQEELDRVTDECVTEIVAKQKVAGYHAITDAENIINATLAQIEKVLVAGDKV